MMMMSGSTCGRELGGGEGAEAGFVERGALFPQAQLQRLLVAEDDRQADRLETVHQADEDGLAVHFVLDPPIAGDDLGGSERDGIEEMVGDGAGGVGRRSCAMAARLA